MCRFFLLLCLLSGWGMVLEGRAQAPSAPSIPAQLVILFENEPAEFKGLTLNKVPFASLEVPMDAATIWPVPAGKQELAVSAPGAEDKKLSLSLNPKQVALLLLALGSNPDPVEKAEKPKAIAAEIFPLDLPAPDRQGRVFVFVPPNGKTLQGMEVRGKANPKPIEMKAGRVTSLGVGSVAVMVGDQQVVAADPGNPGLYVFVILAGKDGKLRSVPFNFLVEEPEAPLPPEKANQTKPADF